MSINKADEYGGGPELKAPLKAAGAKRESTMRSSRAVETSSGRTQPAEDAPHERDAGVRDGVFDGVCVADTDVNPLDDAMWDDCAWLDIDVTAVCRADTENETIAEPLGVVDGDDDVRMLADSEGNAGRDGCAWLDIVATTVCCDDTENETIAEPIGVVDGDDDVRMLADSEGNAGRDGCAWLDMETSAELLNNGDGDTKSLALIESDERELAVVRDDSFGDDDDEAGVLSLAEARADVLRRGDADCDTDELKDGGQKLLMANSRGAVDGTVTDARMFRVAPIREIIAPLMRKLQQSLRL